LCFYSIFFLPVKWIIVGSGYWWQWWVWARLGWVGKTLVVISVIVVAREIAVVGWLATDLDSTR